MNQPPECLQAVQSVKKELRVMPWELQSRAGRHQLNEEGGRGAKVGEGGPLLTTKSFSL